MAYLNDAQNILDQCVSHSYATSYQLLNCNSSNPIGKTSWAPSPICKTQLLPACGLRQDDAVETQEYYIREIRARLCCRRRHDPEAASSAVTRAAEDPRMYFPVLASQLEA